MRCLYLDVFSGLSGDMFLGAMVDLGVSLPRLEAELGKLGVGGYHLHVSRRVKSGIEGVKFDVHLDSEGHGHGHDHGHDDAHGHGHDHGHGHHHGPGHGHAHDPASGSHPAHAHPHDHDHGHEHGRTHAQIRRLIEQSALSDWVKARSLAVFQRIAIAEGKIHGCPPSDVHFHEVGAVDSIVDVVGACVALDLLGRPEVHAGPVVEGTGFVRCAHGRMPLPAPATLEIFAARGVIVTQCEEPHELVTPTGAALLAEFARSFGPLAEFRASQVGYGLGTRDNRTRPNVLRAVLGERASAPEAAGAAAHDWETDTVAVLECHLDDAAPEVLGSFLERAMADGALDVSYVPAQMKKNRPGTRLVVLCEVARADEFAARILRETTAFGVRQTLATRRKLRRDWITVKTSYGDVSVKIGRLDGQVVQRAPEYESCRAAAEASGATVRDVFEAARRAASDAAV